MQKKKSWAILMVMEIKVKRFDKSLPLPTYQTKGAACVDLYCREEKTIQPGQVSLIPLNLALEMPPGHWALLAARSSTHKLGLLMVNGIGVIDSDFCGNDDELRFPALNFTQEPVVVKKGARVAQVIFLPRDKAVLKEVDRLKGENRGAFGTTGGLKK